MQRLFYAFTPMILVVGVAVSPASGQDADLFDLLGSGDAAEPVGTTVFVTHNEPRALPDDEGPALSVAIAWDSAPDQPSTPNTVPGPEPSLISDGVVLVSDAFDAQPLSILPPVVEGHEFVASPEFAEQPEFVPSPEFAEPLVAVETGPLTRPVFQLTVDSAADPRLVEQMATLPEDFAIADLSIERFGSWYAPTSEVASRPPRFAATSFTWAAPAVYHGPLLFEQPNLERYGHHVQICEGDELTQSAISTAHFFATIPVLPYKIGATGGFCGCGDGCPRNYVLGTYRPGSCNPHQLVKPRWSWSGALYQGAATTGLVYLIP